MKHAIMCMSTCAHTKSHNSCRYVHMCIHIYMSCTQQAHNRNGRGLPIPIITRTYGFSPFKLRFQVPAVSHFRPGFYCSRQVLTSLLQETQCAQVGGTLCCLLTC